MKNVVKGTNEMSQIHWGPPCFAGDLEYPVEHFGTATHTFQIDLVLLFFVSKGKIVGVETPVASSLTVRRFRVTLVSKS